MPECSSCNYRNPVGVTNCMTCGRGIQQGPRNNPASVYPVAYHQQTPLSRPKMAVFDIDDTLFDTSQRTANAIRAGLAPSTPYTGDRKPSEYPKGRKAFMDFFDSPKQFRIDPVISGALEYVRGLAQDGYTIAYLTGRNKRRYDATLEHLRETGFPIFRRQNGEQLLYMKPSKGKTDKFKFDTMRDLQSEYDIHYFFDDLEKNREQAFRLGVIGVYHLPDRLGIRVNPTPLARFLQEQKEEEEERKGFVGGGIHSDASTYKWRGNPSSDVPRGYREAAGCIVQRASDGKVLLLRRSILETSMHGMYELPGGKLEEGETPSQAALIETKEEAGLDVKIVQRLPSHVDDDMRKVYHGFIAVPKKNAKVVISEEHDEYKWMTIEEALKLSDRKLSHHARFLFHQMQGSVKSNPYILGKTEGPSGLSIHVRIPPKVDPKKAKKSIKGTKIVQKPGPDDKKCVSCVHYCVKTGKCHLWSKKKGSEVLVLPDWFCQGYEMLALPNPLPKPRKKNGRKEPSKNFVKRMMGNKKMRAEFPDSGQRYAVTLRLVEKHYGKAARKKIAPRENPSLNYTFEQGLRNPPNAVPIFSGEPKGITKNLGGIFAEIQVGRNFVKDIGEAVQSIYRGLIGGRTSMAEKRMAMAIAEMQKELSDAAVKKGGNAVANLKIDYEMIPETATVTLIANADAIKMRSPPKNNPAPSKKVNKAKEAYKKFHGGKAPKEVKTETIDVGEVWYGLGPCWSIGYMSPKETGDDGQKYIHHTNEDSKDGNYPMMYATMPENGEPMIVIKGGSMKIGMRDGLAWLID